jgi:hypothetical protein
MTYNGVFEKKGHYQMIEKAGLYWHFCRPCMGICIPLFLSDLIINLLFNRAYVNTRI